VLLAALLVAAIGLPVVAGGQQRSTASRALVFDPARVSSYSDRELIQLLSREAIEVNLVSDSGLFSLLPTTGIGRVTDSSGNWAYKSVQIRGPQDSGISYPEVVVGELTRRRPISELVQAFDTSDFVQQSWILEVFSNIRTPEVDSVLRKVATAKGTDYPQYLALKYFAVTGTPWALAVLNCNYFGKYPVPDLEWTSIVSLFGKYRYYHATRNLVNTLDFAFVTLDRAAFESLMELYPEGPKQFTSPDSAVAAWTLYLAHHPRPDQREINCPR